MTRRLATLVAAALLVTPAPARASGDSTFYGSCSFNSVAQETVTGDQNQFVGEARTITVLYGGGHANVVNATVACEVRVNGVPQTSASQWGSGVVAFAAPMSFYATEVDDVRLCTIVDFTSDDTPTVNYCPGPTTTEFPPYPTTNYLNDTLHWYNTAVVTYVDPVVCAQTDDVYYPTGDKLWDCPPYDGEYEPWPPGETPPPPYPPYTPAPPGEPTGGGYNVGDTGLLSLVSPDRDVASACAFLADRSNGTAAVAGSTMTAGAETTGIRCRLEDTATGAVLYDQTVTADAPVAELTGTVPLPAGPVTVCTEGTGVWGDRTVAVGLHCRPGEPLS